MKHAFLLILSFLHSSILWGAVSLPNVIGDHMVLQRNLPVPIWGWADPKEEVTVTFSNQSKTTTADTNGNWMVKLDPLSAHTQPATLSVQGTNKIELQNILVGEVWICSGQSNMEWHVRQCANQQEEIANANYPQIRLFDVPGHTIHPIPQAKGNGNWQVCSPTTIATFSATGYYFGRRVHKALNVPVGLIGSNWGGTRIEPWTTIGGFKSVPELSSLADQVASYTPSTRIGAGSPSAIYNSMVHPLTPFAMRGAIWYQGESNGNEGESYYYKKHALVNGWRKAFQNPKLAFYWTQLCSWDHGNLLKKGEVDKHAWARDWGPLREAQFKALDIPNSGMAVIIDLADAHNPGDIHPRNKQDVGWRLAQWALHQTYGKKELIPSGPLLEKKEVENGKIRLSFKYTGRGLMVGEKKGTEPTKPLPNGKLAEFEIAGADKQWFPADAQINGHQVVVSSTQVKEPIAVRYAYYICPIRANLYNQEGLPASPFRTDNW
jgi:sialate O-acetylesterase